MPAQIGLDIGSSSIKLIGLSGKLKRPKLEAFGLAVNPVGNLETENQTEQIKIAETIKKLFEDAAIKERKAVVSLPESKVFTRVVDIPVLSDSELASAISWEAEQYIPVPISEVQLDYRVLNKPGDATADAKMKILLVAAPKLVVNKFIHLLEISGIETEAIDTEILGLVRALAKDADKVNLFLIHLGMSTTDLCIVEQGMLVFTRVIPTGGKALSRVLASELGLQANQAEQYKRSYGLDGSQLQGKVRNALLPVFISIMEEVKKAMHFYTSTRKGKISRIVLSGGGAYLPQITSQIARDTGLEVIIGKPFNGIEISEVQKQRVGAISSVFSVATGLAMRGLD